MLDCPGLAGERLYWSVSFNRYCFYDGRRDNNDGQRLKENIEKVIAFYWCNRAIVGSCTIANKWYLFFDYIFLISRRCRIVHRIVRGRGVEGSCQVVLCQENSVIGYPSVVVFNEDILIGKWFGNYNTPWLIKNDIQFKADTLVCLLSVWEILQILQINKWNVNMDPRSHNEQKKTTKTTTFKKNISRRIREMT